MLNSIIGRVGDVVVSVSVLCSVAMQVFVAIGITSGGPYSTITTDAVNMTAGIPHEFNITSGLSANTQYYYQISYREGSSGSWLTHPEGSFRTVRNTGSTFTFTLTSDTHLGDAGLNNPDLYNQTLQNINSDNPDFHITLGDEFMINMLSNPTYDDVDEVVANQRPYLSELQCPLYLVVGNREMERGWLLDGTADNLPVWAANARNKYFPNPVPDNFYTGNTESENYVGKRRNYYAWEWGDALFIVLDQWWYTETNPGQSGDDWDWTIGDDQYNWFKSELEGSSANYKFVFTHHVLGGVRGGAKWVTQYEVGGKDSSGNYELDVERATWAESIHQLMVENRVTALFQGHDHIYVYQPIDGMVYQAVPMPGDATYNLRNDGDYETGTKYANSGHVRVEVSPTGVDVDYVRSYLPGDGGVNQDVSHSYAMTTTSDPFVTLLNPGEQYPKDAIKVRGVGFGTSGSRSIHFGGKSFTSSHSSVNSWSDTEVDVDVPNYKCNKFGPSGYIQRDVWVTNSGTDSDKHKLRILEPVKC